MFTSTVAKGNHCQSFLYIDIYRGKCQKFCWRYKFTNSKKSKRRCPHQTTFFKKILVHSKGKRKKIFIYLGGNLSFWSVKGANFNDFYPFLCCFKLVSMVTGNENSSFQGKFSCLFTFVMKLRFEWYIHIGISD